VKAVSSLRGRRRRGRGREGGREDTQGTEGARLEGVEQEVEGVEQEVEGGREDCWCCR